VHAVDPAADGPASGGLVAAVLEYYRRYTARALGGADSLGVSVFAACGHRFSVDDPRAVFESNISLTAVVLLWNISDYMFQNSETLNEEIKKEVSTRASADDASGLVDQRKVMSF